MNQQAAKENRKEIRRAIGTDAANLLDHLAALSSHHENRFAVMDTKIAAVFTDLAVRVTRLEATQSTLWTRFRALIVGS